MAYAILPRGTDDVGLDGQIDSEEVGRVGGVGQDACLPGGGQDYDLEPVVLEKGLLIGLAGEVEFGRDGAEKVGISRPVQGLPAGAAHHAPVPGHENPGCFVHLPIPLGGVRPV